MNDTPVAPVASSNRWRIAKYMRALLIALFALAVAGSVAAYLLTKRYFAEVIIQVTRPGAAALDAQFVATQFQILRKTEVLYPVIERLELTKVDGPDGAFRERETYFRLKNFVDLQEARHAGLIKIGVHDKDAQQAANIANAIALVYQEHYKSLTEKERASHLEDMGALIRLLHQEHKEGDEFLIENLRRWQNGPLPERPHVVIYQKAEKPRLPENPLPRFIRSLLAS